MQIISGSGGSHEPSLWVSQGAEHHKFKNSPPPLRNIISSFYSLPNPTSILSCLNVKTTSSVLVATELAQHFILCWSYGSISLRLALYLVFTKKMVINFLSIDYIFCKGYDLILGAFICSFLIVTCTLKPFIFFWTMTFHMLLKCNYERWN